MKRGMQQVFKVAGLGGVSVAMALGMALASPAALAKQVIGRYPHSVVFTGQLIFPGDTFATRLLHNYMSFAIQRQLYYEGIPVLVLPIRM